MGKSDITPASVLVVDDEVGMTAYLKRFLKRKGYNVDIAENAKAARAAMERLYPDVVLMDLRLPDADGSELMSELRQDYPDARFIVVTAYGSIKSAVESTRRGAVDYLTKPFEPEELLVAIQNAMSNQILSEELQRLRSNQQQTTGRGDRVFVYPSAAMQEVLTLAHQAASQEGIVLLLGESGSGKDYLARWIHDHSERRDKPYFAINCAAVSRELAENELFGHEHGAFTGSKGRKRGMLELANHGTILLNEIGEMDLVLQSKLLSFLDTMSFMRVGGESSIVIDTRIIAATNRDLQAEVEKGRFRKDLYYRLNVTAIDLPPLRERTDDIPNLVNEFLDRFARDMRLPGSPEITQEALATLKSYPWPGNIRELRNILERAIITSPDGTITHTHLSFADSTAEWSHQIKFPSGNQTLKDITEDATRSLIREALRRSKNKVQAAKLLGISRDALNYQIRILKL